MNTLDFCSQKWYNPAIMGKQKFTILLIALMCFGPISGLSIVVCYGANGHIAVEPTIHGHCESSELDESGCRKDSSQFGISLSSDHGHCRDILVTSNVVIPARKNIKLSTHKVFTTNLSLKSTSIHTSSVFSLATQSYDLSSFFAPLRTVILLA